MHWSCRLVECEPDVNQWRLQEGDSFAVLASDGLWDVMSDQEAVNSVQVVHLSVMTSAGHSSIWSLYMVCAHGGHVHSLLTGVPASRSCTHYNTLVRIVPSALLYFGQHLPT